MAKRRNRRNRNYTNNPHSGSSGLIGLAVLGVGAYFLYEWLSTPSTSVGVPVNPTPASNPIPTTPGNVAITPTSPTSTQVSPTSGAPIAIFTSSDPIYSSIPVSSIPSPNASSNTAQALLNAAYAAGYQSAMQNSGNKLNVDEWNYWFNQATGTTVSAAQTSAIENIVGGDILIDVNTYLNALGQVTASGISGLGIQSAAQELQPVLSNRASMQNAPYGMGLPGRPFNETFDRRRASVGFAGLGRTYLSGYHGIAPGHDHSGVPGMSGLGVIGEGYNINETTYGGASAYELATKHIM
jgi:hypothetical protein